MSLPATPCASALYEVPTALLAQNLTYCASDIFGNHTSILTTCCDDNNGSITSSTDGCNLYCAIDRPALNSTASCIKENNGATLCGYTNDPNEYISTTSSTSTATNSATNSAPSPSQSNSIRLFAPKTLLLGIVFLLTVSIL